MRFDFTDLQLYLNVAEAGSITAGAQRSHITLASASARIAGMEEVLGAPLLLRSRNGVSITDAGRTLLQHARIILRQAQQMHGELTEFAQGLKGRIRILCNTSAITEFLPDAISAYMASHPYIDIDLEERLSFNIVHAVTEGAADIGIVSDAVSLVGLEALPFARDQLVLVTAYSHPFASQEATGISFSETLSHHYIGLAGDSALQRYLDDHALSNGQRIRYRVRLRSFSAICQMVAAGIGISIIPESAATRYRLHSKIKIVPLTDAWASRNLIICVRHFDALPAYVKEMVDSIRA